jgi:hypothetical protein
MRGPCIHHRCSPPTKSGNDGTTVVNNIFAWHRMNFAIVVYCLRCACRFSTCIDSFSHFWTDRGQHGEESEEGEEDREKSSQEENREEEEVVSYSTNKSLFSTRQVLTRGDGLSWLQASWSSA